MNVLLLVIKNSNLITKFINSIKILSYYIAYIALLLRPNIHWISLNSL